MKEGILTRNNVTVSGEGDKTIVFAHGFGCDQLVWRQVAQAFEKDYRVVLFDYVGAGKSDKSAYSIERYGSIQGYKQDLLEVCAALELKDIIFIGHSISSMIGMLASIDQPELMERLVMIGPSPRFLNEPGYFGGFDLEDIDELLEMMELNYREWAKYLAPVVMQNENRPELTHEFEALLSSNDPVITRQFAEVTFKLDLRDELAKFQAPVLILQPSKDVIAPVEVGQFLHSKIPQSKFVLMEAAGHNPHMSDAGETISRIKEYLAE
jgi:sigma-B regulation protein RsbQ